MTFKSIKTLALTMMMLGAVACGKNKNNLKIDGTYELESSTSGGQTVTPTTTTLMEVNGNVATTYTFSDTNSAVEIKQEQLKIKGKKILGTKTLDDKCDTSSTTGETAENISMTKSGGKLIMNDGFTTNVYKSISDDKDKMELITSAKKVNSAEGSTMARSCINPAGKPTKVIVTPPASLDDAEVQSALSAESEDTPDSNTSEVSEQKGSGNTADASAQDGVSEQK